ncbi:MAG TPA: IS21 family transposase [Paracoccaceae bacterium]
MLTGEMTLEIRILHRQGLSIRAIARQLQISRETVRKYLRAPDLAPSYGPRETRPSKLDPFKPYVTMRIAEAAPRRLPATVYLRELRARGYDGGISILKGWLAEQYPTLPSPQIIRFETPPGRQAQVDWTVIRRGKNKLSAFVGTLGFSRLSFVWFADNERFDTLVEAHEKFFDALGGVPHTILFDSEARAATGSRPRRTKTVLIDRDAYGPGQHRFNAGFRDFAKHHGFSPRVCAPYRAQTKGKVERFNRYLKESFVWPLESRLKGQGLILDAATANVKVGAWLRDVANPRIHAETRERPIDRFARETAQLLPRGQVWTGIAASVPIVLRDIHVPQHDLSVYDAIGRLA